MATKTPEPAYKPQAGDTAPLAAIEANASRNDWDGALIATVKLMCWNLRMSEPGGAQYVAAVNNLGKLILEIKKSKGSSASDKEALLNELAAWMDGKPL